MEFPVPKDIGDTNRNTDIEEAEPEGDDSAC